MRRPLAVALAALSLALAACPSKDAHTLLAEGRYSAAAEGFEEELAALKPSDAGWMAAKQGHIAALAHVDAARATKDARELLKSHGAELGERGVAACAAFLGQHGAYGVALDLLGATVEPWPVSELLDAAHTAAAFGLAGQDKSEEARKKLAGMGYIGGAKPPPVPRPGSKTPPRPKD